MGSTDAELEGLPVARGRWEAALTVEISLPLTHTNIILSLSPSLLALSLPLSLPPSLSPSLLSTRQS